jgi:[ribosomal protein S18]-alanine N-acetyltransferase
MMDWHAPGDEAALADLFAGIDTTHFHPHAMDAAGAAVVVAYRGQDVYRVLVADGRSVAYGILRGWDEGYSVPSLGVAVRTSDQGRGYGREAMRQLHADARTRGATSVRLRVAHANVRARRLYASMGYEERGEERGELLMVAAL